MPQPPSSSNEDNVEITYGCFGVCVIFLLAAVVCAVGLRLFRIISGF